MTWTSRGPINSIRSGAKSALDMREGNLGTRVYEETSFWHPIGMKRIKNSIEKGRSHCAIERDVYVQD